VLREEMQIDGTELQFGDLAPKAKSKFLTKY
jgi:hypothetical protein